MLKIIRMRTLIIATFFLLGFQLLQGQTFFGLEQIIIDSEVNGPNSIIIIDVNGDETNDMVTSSFSDNKIAWYEGLGNNDFSEQKVIYEDTDFPTKVIDGDMDNDGDIDLIVTYYETNEIAILKNDGYGNFDEPVLLASDLNYVRNLKVGDFDDDGWMDIAISGTSPSNDGSKINIFYNNGQGEILAYQTVFEDLNVEKFVSALNFNDMNDDNKTDMIVGISRRVSNGTVDGIIAWIENNGDRSFGTQHLVEEVTWGLIVDQLETGDIDNDNDIDVISYYKYSASIIIHLNEGTNSFINQILVENTDNDIVRFELTDLDNDEDLDFVISYREEGWILKNQGGASFADTTEISLDNNLFFAGDITNDGYKDIVSAGLYTDDISWFENLGNTYSLTAQLVVEGSAASQLRYVEFLDMDGDEDLDVLTVSVDNISWWEQISPGVYGPPQFIFSLSSQYLNYLFFEKINADDLKDLVLIREGNNYLLFNNGDGTFEEGPIPDFLPLQLESIDIGDIDGDGDNDIMTGGAIWTSNLQWFPNNGNGIFGNPQIAVSDINVAELELYDIDVDGDLDMVGGSGFFDTELFWIPNLGNGVFGERVFFRNNIRDVWDIECADFDGDNDIDILTAQYTDNTLSWYENQGDNTFGQQTILYSRANLTNGIPVATLNMNIGDMDNDGDIDIVGSSYEYDEGFWIENEGNGNFSSENIIADLYRASSVQAGDMDGDGNLDLLVASNTLDKIIWHENLLGDTLMVVEGTTFWDRNESGLLESSDYGLAGGALNLTPDGRTIYANSIGEFSFAVSEEGDYTLTAEAPFILDCFGPVDLEPSIPIDASFDFTYNPFDVATNNFAFEALTSCRRIGGAVIFDRNENGIIEVEERGTEDIWLEANNLRTYSRNRGKYEFELPNDEDIDVGVDAEGSSWGLYCRSRVTEVSQTFPSNPLNYHIPAGIEDLDTIDFGITIDTSEFINLTCTYLGVDYGTVPGEEFGAYMAFSSRGYITEACTMRIEHDPQLIFLYSFFEPIAQGEDYIEWLFHPEDFFDRTVIAMRWYLSETAVVGDTLHWEASYICPNGIDACDLDNVAERDIIIQEEFLRREAGFAKLLSLNPQGEMPELVNQEEVLSYVINFQNPLETTAYNLTIIDTLPDEFLDISTMSFPYASASANFRIVAPNILIWEFENINLTDATEDLVNSYGFVQFNIALKPDLQAGTVISNKATVWFNGVESKITNQIDHKIGDITSTNINNLSEFEWSVFPNPFITETILNFDKPLPFGYDVELLTATGIKVRNYYGVGYEPIRIKRDQLPSGIYIFNLYKSGTRELLGNKKVILE